MLLTKEQTDQLVTKEQQIRISNLLKRRWHGRNKREAIQGKGPGHKVGDTITVSQRPRKGWHRSSSYQNPQPALIVERYVTCNGWWRNPAYTVRLADGRVRRVQ